LDKDYFNPGLFHEAAVKRKELDNLFILTGSYKLEDYEYFSENSVLRLIENAYLNFDLTILLVNRSIYDSFTISALIKSDYNLIPINADLDKLREFNSYIAFLNGKQNIPENKYKFVAFEYDAMHNVDPATMEAATEGNFSGIISRCGKRTAFRNLSGIYAKSMTQQNLDEYEKLFENFNILRKKSITEKLFDRLGDIFKIRSVGEKRREELKWSG
ncbi:MAG: hypothetical protein HGA22_07110, partial [Clostridiales bacterium]|nr:hypothetical protein [Clostridiales bacterium]